MRDQDVDSAKGVLIFLVVLGHTAGMMIHYVSSDTGRVLAFIYKWIYLFHMPAFFFLAGYVGALRKAKAKRFDGFGMFIVKKVRRLVVPYFVWGVVSVVVFLAMGSFVGVATGGMTQGHYGHVKAASDWWQPFVSLLHAGGWPKGEGFRCNSVLWFLPVMFVVSVVERMGECGCAALRAARPRCVRLRCVEELRARGVCVEVLTGWGRLVLMGCVAVGCFVLGGILRLGHVGGLPWGLGLAPYYQAFMVLGRVVGEVKTFEGSWLKRNHVVLRGWLGRCLLTLGWGAFAVVSWGLPNMACAWWKWKWFVIQGLMAVWGSVWLLMTVKMFSRNATPTQVPHTSLSAALTHLGLASLGVMVTHKFFVLPIQVAFGRWGGLGHLERLGGRGELVCIFLAIIISIAIAFLTYRLTLFLRQTVPFVLGEKKVYLHESLISP